MSQFSKKGIKLSTKHSSKSRNQHPSKIDTSSHFNSFLSTKSVATQEKNKDDFLLSFDSSLTTSNEIDSDVFGFPKKVINSPNKSSRSPKASLQHPGKKKSESIFFNETIINSTTSDEHCLKPESSHIQNQPELDDSILIFQPRKEVDNIAENSDADLFPDKDVPIYDSKTREVMKDVPEESDVEFIKQCPICFKTVTKYVSHMKSCAAKNKMTTQQLLSALKLHKKQIAERKELGLGILAPSFRAKASPKTSRGSEKKGPVDSNLQLALALSASLRSAEEDEVIQEAEALKEAGLSDEAEKKLSTLENFGFVSALPPAPKTAQGSSRSRALAPSLLLARSKEERNRIITEKVAIILISEEENAELSDLLVKEPVLRSKHLKKIWARESELWRKALCAADEERSGFYVQSLSEFVSPSKTEVGENMRRLSQLPGRLKTPVKEEFSELPTPTKSTLEKAQFSEMATPSRLLMRSKEEFYQDSVFTGNNYRINKLSEDWKMLVNDSVFSDVEIQCESSLTVPAHKLVFHVRCPNVLTKVVHRENKDVIVWQTHSKTSVLAFLEFVYCGISERLSNLDPEDLCSLRYLADEFDFNELKTQLNNFKEKCSPSVFDKSKKGDIKQNLFGADPQISVALDRLDCKRNRFLSDSSTSANQSELNVKNTPDSPKIEVVSNISNGGRGSPDMFRESTVIDEESSSQESREDLDILASLIGKPTCEIEAQYNDMNPKHSFEEGSVFVLDSPVPSPKSRCNSIKRKALNSSLSEDENDSLSKKSRPDFSHSRQDLNKEDVFDLTQSSNSSKEEPFENIKNPRRDDGFALNISSPNGSEEDLCLDNLTQRMPSANSSPKSQSPTAVQDYIPPVWDGFDDDYLFYNYEVINTPTSVRKNSVNQKDIATSSDEKQTISCSPKLSTKITTISSDSESPKQASQKTHSHSSLKTPNKTKFNSKPSNKLSQIILSPSPKKLSQITLSPSPKSCPKIKYISSDSKSPKRCSQRTLDDYTSQSKLGNPTTFIGGSDSESVANVSPSESLTNTYLKSRKNLSSQFYRNSKNTVDDNSQTIDSQECYSRKCSQNHTKEKSPKKKDAMDALKRLLDDSLEISDSLFVTADAILASERNDNQQAARIGGPSTSEEVKVADVCEKKKSSLMTPSPEIVVSDNVTPLPDYSAMKTPSLKKELGRFGLKPSLGRRKAKMLLRYIYDQTHPLVADPEFKQPEGQPPRSPVKSPSKSAEVNLVNSESDSEESFSQKSTCSSVSSSATLPEESFFEQDDFSTQELPTSDTRASFRNLILSNCDLQRKVLMYEPIYLEELMATLKANGIKSKANDVMDFLDEQCITFRTTSWKATNEKRKQKQRTPKKKRKEKSESETLTQEQKTTPKKTASASEAPNVIKKRGRPRKNP